MKFGQNPISGLKKLFGLKMSFQEIVDGCMDGRMHGRTTDNGQNVITKAHPFTT